jgi:hypothetical protein
VRWRICRHLDHRRIAVSFWIKSGEAAEAVPSTKRIRDPTTGVNEAEMAGSSGSRIEIGLDVHNEKISYCVRDVAGHVHREGKIGSGRRELGVWVNTVPVAIAG